MTLRQSFYNHPASWALGACLIPIAVCLCLMILDGRNLIKAQFGVAQREAEKTRTALHVEMQGIRVDAVKAITDTRKDLLVSVNKLVAAVPPIVSTLTETVGAYQDLAMHLADATDNLKSATDDIKPVLVSANKTVLDADKSITQMTPFAIGTLGGLKVAAGDLGTMGRDAQKAMPEILATVQRIGDNSERATAKSTEAMEQTRLVMANLAEETRPLPKWMRYTFGIAGVVAPSAAGAIGAAAAVGAFR